MPDEKPKDGEKKVAYDVNNPKYCRAGKCYCNNVRVKDASIDSKMCVASGYPAQIVDNWTRCPCLEKSYFTLDPYEQAFLEYNRSLTEGCSETIAFKIFKQAVSKHFEPIKVFDPKTCPHKNTHSPLPGKPAICKDCGAEL